MSDVFISYKREERPRVERIADLLRELRLECWFDAKLETGISFDEEIARELDSAAAILVLWTPAAYASEWVRGEALKGLERKVLAAAFTEKVSLYPPFNTVQAEDLSSFPSERGQPPWDHAGWLKVVDRIAKLVARPGLAEYCRIRAKPTPDAYQNWAIAYPGDPLAEGAWELVRQITHDLAAQRIEEARAASLRRQAASVAPQEVVAPLGHSSVDPAESRSSVRRPRTWRSYAVIGSSLAVAAVAIGGGLALMTAPTAATAPTQQVVAETTEAPPLLPGAGDVSRLNADVAAAVAEARRAQALALTARTTALQNAHHGREAATRARNGAVGTWVGLTPSANEYAGEVSHSADGELVRTGFAELRFPRGILHIGFFRNGDLDGPAVSTYAEGPQAGGRYEGDTGRLCSPCAGVDVFGDGRRIEGTMLEREANGPGVYIRPDGLVYEGEFKNGRRDGLGVEWAPDGTFRAGVWSRGDLVEPLY